ncbi:hypothetical protein CFP65_2629 [Kitasatospora sp. MMS16-BH015]|uniref:condensation domain-containing protein n=1 Tax=Kitasatospora sp. MMS16-BH015 TaxID=2018025 RepID=UPI000CA3952A|nr:condensation domain-containing protein [Kitasatospora sp. MMS16-BH015]AUG77454.1 hypothetical protein CFP65_2629 [Kitasatospora sp. MMS16-BH015]
MVDPASRLLRILREQLAAPGLDLDGKFYAQGGDSLTAVRVVNTARAEGLPLTLRDLMVHQSVRAIVSAPTFVQALAEQATAERPAAGDTAWAPFDLLAAEDRDRLPAGVVEALPASALQVGMLYLCELSQDRELYQVMDDWEVEAPFDEPAFRAALAELVRRHPALRTCFDFAEYSVPVQLVREQADPVVEIEPAATAEEAEAALRHWRDSGRGGVHDWAEAPLVRVHVAVRPESFHVAFAAHHAILDGWSYSRVAVELMTLYAHGTAAGQLPAPAGPVQRAFVRAEQEALGSAAAAEHWLAQADAPPLLFADHGAGIPDASARHVLDLEPELVRGLHRVARRLGTSVKSVALAAHARALGALAGREEDVVTGVVFNTRPPEPGSDLAVGLFLNTLPVRFARVGDDWADLVRAAAEAEREGAPHQAYPQAALVERLGRPAFDVTFNFMNFRDQQELADLTAAPTSRWRRRGKPSFPFHVNLEITGGRGQLRIGHDPAHLPQERAESYAGLLAGALAAVVRELAGPADPADSAEAVGPVEALAVARPRFAVLYDAGAVPAGEIGAGLADLGEILFLVPRHSAHVDNLRSVMELLGEVHELTGDQEADLRLVRGLAPDGILTFCEDLLRPAAEFAEALGLPGQSPHAARVFTDKGMQRRILREAGVDTTRTFLLAAPTDWAEAVAAVGLPAIVKPVTGSRSRDAYSFRDPAEAEAVRERLERIAAAGLWEPFVVEEYHEGRPSEPFGDYVSVESLCTPSGITHLVLTGKTPVMPPFRGTGRIWPSHLPAAEEAEVLDLVTAALEAVGADHGHAHTELKLTARGPKLIELNGRISGHVNMMARESCGTDLVRATGLLALGEDPQLAPFDFGGKVHFQYNNLSPLTACTIEAVDGAEAVRSLPGVTGYRSFVRMGDQLPGGTSTLTLDALSGVGDSHAEVARTIEAARAALTFTFGMPEGPRRVNGLDLARH